MAHRLHTLAGMVHTAFLFIVLSSTAFAAARTPAKAGKAPFDPNAVNEATLVEPVRRGASRAAILRAQVLLDRANFSVGEIDAAFGSNVQKAISAFQSSKGMRATGTIEAEDWALLNADSAPALIACTITEADIAGPFVKVPADMMEKSKLDALAYESLIESLGERFHASPKLLKLINPQATFQTAGEQILVPNVMAELPPKAAKIVVDKSDRSVSALDAEGKVIAYYPASMGSEHDPLPIGTWKINGVQKDPPFFYNPKLFWDADPSHSKAKIKPGPNNPVGLVWIDLSKEHYGIHGTPEPATVGKTQSHGCIRLTNWDAVELSGMVAPNMQAILQE